MQTLTAEQFKKKYGNNAVNSFAKTEQPSFVKETAQDLSQIGSDIKSSIESGTSKINQAMDRAVAGEQGALRTTAQQIGTGLGTASSILGDVFKGVVKSALPQSWETGIKSGVTGVINPVMETQIAKNIIQKYNSLDPKTKADIDAMIGAGQFALDVATLGGSKKVGELAIEQGAKGAIKAGEITGKAFDLAGNAIKPISETTGNFVSGVKDIVEANVREVSKIPGRIATNATESRATTEAIKQLPTQIAKDAVQNGVDINDIKYLYKLPSTQKKPLKQLFTAVKDFASGNSKTNPIEVVGKPIVERIKTLKSSLGTIGQKLGKVADELGPVTTDEALPKVFGSLKKVPGLNGLEVGVDGTLDFTNTVLTTAETAGDRKAIQQIFSDAIKDGTGKQKHLLRQELFETLGGKKGAMVAMTETQDKAYQAIRQGLSDILDEKNSSYKLLNSQYRKVAQPLNDIGRFMKLNKLSGAEDDILNMDAGLLARRLTSNATSNPEIRNILRSLDNATKTAGKTTLSVENLQDFYNLLDKYYNIAGATGLQKQVGLGIEKSSGLLDAAYKIAGKVAGKSDAVRMKAIEKAIIDALK